MFLDDPAECLANDPESELAIGRTNIELVEKLRPLLHILIDKFFQASLRLHKALLRIRSVCARLRGIAERPDILNHLVHYLL